MKKIKIKIVLIGIPSTKIDCKYLANWNSKLFMIESVPILSSNLSKFDFDGINLSSEIIDEIFKTTVDTDNIDLIVGVTDRKLDQDWFTQRITEKSFVISFHEFENLLKIDNIPLENLILRFIYPFSLIFIFNKNSLPIEQIPNSNNSLIHYDSQRCIFDFMKYKIDIIDTLVKPELSDYSRLKLLDVFSENFLNIIKNELQKIDIRLFYRIKKWIFNRPILALFLSGIFALAINLISTIIYEFFCK